MVCRQDAIPTAVPYLLKSCLLPRKNIFPLMKASVLRELSGPPGQKKQRRFSWGCRSSLSWRCLSKITGLGQGMQLSGGPRFNPQHWKRTKLHRRGSHIGSSAMWTDSGILRNVHCLSRRLVYGPTETTVEVPHPYYSSCPVLPINQP